MSGHKRWSRDADGMEHPDDSIRLAYIRQQRLAQNWQDSIHRHIAGCEACQKRCKELRQTSALLDGALLHEPRKRPSLSIDESRSAWDWVESPQAAQLAYQHRRQERQSEALTLGIALLTRLPFVLLAKAMPALAPHVRKLLAHKRQPTDSAMKAVPAISFPSAMFLVVLSIVIVFAYTMVMHNPLGATYQSGKPTVGPQATIQILSHPTETPTAVPVPSGKGTATTSTSGGRRPTISVCGSKSKGQNRLYICGSGFKPGDRVELIINPGSNGARTGHPVQVNGDGGFQTFLNINSCKDVPMSIIARDVQHSSIVSQALTHIAYGGRCSPTPVPTVETEHHH